MNVCMAPCPIVFDLDGTLIDSAPDIHACVNAVLRQNRLAPLGQDRVRSFIGGGVDLLWTRIIAALRIIAIGFTRFSFGFTIKMGCLLFCWV